MARRSDRLSQRAAGSTRIPVTHSPPATTPPPRPPREFGKGDSLMRSSKRLWFLLAACTVAGGVLVWLGPTLAQQPPEKKPSSYLPVIEEKLDVVLARMSADKPKVMKRQQDLLAERYDLGNRPGQGAKMSRSKPIQEGVRAKLPSGVTWESLAKM